MFTFSLALTLVAAAPESFATFEDKGDLFVKAGSKQGLKVGAEVELLGARIGDTEERRSVGTRTVMEVWETLARLSGPEGAQAEKPERARLLGKAKAVKAEAKKGDGKKAEKKGETSSPSGGSGPAQTSAAMGFSDHLTAECKGRRFDVWARSTLLGGIVTLQIDGEEVASKEVGIGSLNTLKGTKGGVSGSLTVNQGAFGTDYSLTVDGKRCPLTNL